MSNVLNIKLGEPLGTELWPFQFLLAPRTPAPRSRALSPSRPRELSAGSSDRPAPPGGRPARPGVWEEGTRQVAEGAAWRRALSGGARGQRSPGALRKYFPPMVYTLLPLKVDHYVDLL